MALLKLYKLDSNLFFPTFNIFESAPLAVVRDKPNVYDRVVYQHLHHCHAHSSLSKACCFARLHKQTTSSETMLSPEKRHALDKEQWAWQWCNTSSCIVLY